MHYVLKRVLQALLTWLLVITATFVLIQVAPGGPAALSDPDLSQAAREWIARSLGLDQPIPVQYWNWLKNMFTGDFGQSYSDRQSVGETIGKTLPNTLKLSLTALALTVIIGIPLGVISALKRQTMTDYVVSILAFAGLSVPAFWFGIILILVFSVNMHLLPAAGMRTLGQPPSLADSVRYLIMPAAALSLANLAAVVRYTRSSMLTVLDEDFIRTAHAKGVSHARVIYYHALRNALIPVITVVGFGLPALFGGSVVVETVFSWPGMGRLGVNAALQRDYPMIMGITVVMAAVVLAVNLLVDLAYRLVDPRIRYG